MAEKQGADAESESVESLQPDPEASAQSAPQMTLEQLHGALSEAQSAAADAQDQALRAVAESDNVRRRSARDAENARKFALEKFAAELLPVIDSLEKAVESADATSGESAEAIAQGVSLSLKLFLDILGKFGISVLNPLGEPFNPEQHEAVAMVANPDVQPNSIIEVMQKGYLLNGRLLRAAMVVVAKAVADSV